MEIKIEKGLPIPAKRAGLAESMATTLKKMEIGDSFECNEQVCKNAQQTCHRHGMKVLTRKLGKDLYRVWRTS